MTQMNFLHILSCQMLIYDIKTVDSCADTAEIYSDTSDQNVKIVFLHINYVCFFASSNTFFSSLLALRQGFDSGTQGTRDHKKLYVKNI